MSKFAVGTILIFSMLIIYYLFPEKKLPPNTRIDHIEVSKSDRTMNVYSKGNLLKSYSVSLGRGTWGIHDPEWNNITPSGSYIIDSKFTGSSYHKALTISYGNQIEIHGIKNGLGFIGKFHRFVDWTRGCIAVTDEEIDELYQVVPVGTTIMIE
jgi:murein L,D-transpeptidase YafK